MRLQRLLLTFVICWQLWLEEAHVGFGRCCDVGESVRIVVFVRAGSRLRVRTTALSGDWFRRRCRRAKALSGRGLWQRGGATAFWCSSSDAHSWNKTRHAFNVHVYLETGICLLSSRRWTVSHIWHHADTRHSTWWRRSCLTCWFVARRRGGVAVGYWSWVDGRLASPQLVTGRCERPLDVCKNT